MEENRLNKLDDILKKVFEFHGHSSPGTTIGVYMVDYATELMTGGGGRELNAFVETIPCLSDAIQIMMGCTVGNERMHVVDYGKFALTIYDKETGEGVRMKLDPDKTKRYRHLDDWFLKKKPKKDLPKELVIRDIMEAGREVLSYEKVKVEISKEKHPVKFCRICSEPFSSGDDGICGGCRGERYYEITR